MKTRAVMVVGLLATVLGARTNHATAAIPAPARPAAPHATDDGKKGKDGDKKFTLTALTRTNSTWFDGAKKKGDKTDGKLTAVAPKKPKKGDDHKLATVAPKKPKKDDGKQLATLAPKKPKDDGKNPPAKMIVKDTKKKKDDMKLASVAPTQGKPKKGLPKKADGYLYA